jgi:hypothetical protein
MHLAGVPGLGLDEDAGHHAWHAGELLRVGERRERDRAVDQRPDFRGLQDRGEQSRYDARADLQLDRFERGRADRLRYRGGDRERLLTRQLPGGEVAQQRAGQVHVARVGRDQVDRRLAAGRADHARLVLEHRHRGAHPGQTLHVGEHSFAEAL